MNNYLIKIENFIKNKYINLYPTELKDKVLYLLQNGKRLRPILFLLFTGEDELENTINSIYINYKSKKTIIYIVAIIIEILHSLSLILDDLPEMDDDIIRRDNPSFHIKYGIDYTNFFIYYMFNHVGLELDNCNNSFFENKKNKKDKKNKTKNINKQDNELNIKIISDIQTIIRQNINYLIEGQYDDLDWYDNSSNSNVFVLNTSTILFLNEKDIIFELLNIDNELINYIKTIDKVNDIELNIELNIKKTSSLFNLSITSGYILQLWKHNINYLNNKKYNKIYKLLSIFSNILGYMFQISDDILDIESDKVKNNPNICFILDKDIVSKLLKNGCKWLYENAKVIHELMLQSSFEKQILEKQDLKKQLLEKAAPKQLLEKAAPKQLLEKAAPKYSANGLENYETNSDEEYIKYDSDNYSSNESDSEESSSEEVNSEEVNSEKVNSDIKNITFNLKVMNEIIGKIENRIK